MNPDFATKAATFLRTQNAMREWHKAAVGNCITKDVSDAALGTGNFTQGIPAFWFARGIDGGAEGLSAPYARSAIVRRAIKHVSGPISSVDLVFSKPSSSAAMRRYRGKGTRLFTKSGIVKRDPNSEVEMPQIREWLKEPMAGLTYEDFVEASIGWYKLQECFWVLADNEVRVPFPEVKANPYAPIIVARPDRMRPTVEGNNITAWNFTDAGGKVWELEPEQVVRLFGWNPYDPHRGLGDFASAQLAAESHHLGSKFKRNLTGDNDTAPIISAKNGTPTDTQIEQIKMSIMERRAARMRGNSKALFLPGEVDVHDPKILSVDAAFLEGMTDDQHQVYLAFGVPPALGDVVADRSIGQGSDWFALIFNTCIPEGNKFCAALEMLIYRMTGERIEVALNWDEHYVMQAVRSERMKDADSLFTKGVPMKVVNEYLNLGLPEYEEWEQGYIPINLTPVSAAMNEAAQTVPEPQPDDFNETGGTSSTSPQSEKALTLIRAAFVAKAAQQRGPTACRSAASEKIWKQHMRLRGAAIKQYQSKASKVFMQYRVVALRHLANANVGKGLLAAQPKTILAKSLVDILFNVDSFRADLKKNLKPVAQNVLQRAGEEVMEEIGKSGADDPWKMAPSKALEFIGRRDKLLDGVGETAQAQLNTALAEGVDAGETTEQLAGRVKGVFNNLQNFEARRIAMTETSAAYGFSRHEAMADAGIEFKGWLSSHGPNVREAHAQAEADYADSPIAIDEPFIVDGEELMYPGDESGSPGNVINCHCIQIAKAKPTEDES